MLRHDRYSTPDQAGGLRALIESAPSPSLSIGIVSGKGGVGKSNIAVNLSICLAARQCRVTLLDLDLGLANADLLMNLHSRRNLSHVIAGTHSLAEVVTRGLGGVTVITGASGLEHLANLSEFERHRLLLQFQALERDGAFLIMDLGAGIGETADERHGASVVCGVGSGFSGLGPLDIHPEPEAAI
jgi:flagellar biosynthesis protein FlhG